MFEFKRIISRDLINNPHPRQYDLTPEERNSNSSKHNYGNILIQLPRGKKNGNRPVRHRWESLGYVERIWRIIVTPIFVYHIR